MKIRWKQITRFNRINSDRSIPTCYSTCGWHFWDNSVSIVSIQTDHSRPIESWNEKAYYYACFNRINPNRSIPTKHIYFPKVNENWFQSYQSKQINPDIISADISVAESWSFNRINPNRSIPTWKTYPKRKEALRAFQSYQSRQINPDHIKELNHESKD